MIGILTLLRQPRLLLPLIAVLALVAAFAFGWMQRGDREKAKTLQNEIETREAIDNADIPTDPAAVDERLRELAE